MASARQRYCQYGTRAGFALGAATALMGPRAAMACTVAVEEAIDEHYQGQLDALGPEEAPLKEAIEEFPR